MVIFLSSNAWPFRYLIVMTSFPMANYLMLCNLCIAAARAPGGFYIVGKEKPTPTAHLNGA